MERAEVLGQIADLDTGADITYAPRPQTLEPLTQRRTRPLPDLAASTTSRRTDAISRLNARRVAGRQPAAG